MSDDFGEIVEKLRRSTVQVKASRNRGGSGVIWSPDGLIVTNSHVVDGAVNSGEVEVELWDGRRSRGAIVSREPWRDLASVRIAGKGLPCAVPGDSNALRAGELVIAVGNPLGFIGAASTGIVHRATGRDSGLRAFDGGSWVVSQLRLAPGSSGGPLANARGEVIGINTMIAGGLAFAVPSASVEEFLHSGAESGGGLGVEVRPVLVDRAQGYLGLLVLHVVPNSPAERASLLQGDLLVGVGGRRFHSVHDLRNAIAAHSGGVLELQFRRGASDSVRAVVAQLTAIAARAA